MSTKPLPIYCTGGCDACRDYARELGVPLIVPRPDASALDVERVAAFLHDEYGCRITCRGGRLANDRDPSHVAAYRSQAERLLAALDAARPSGDLDRLRAFAEKVANSEKDTPGTRAAARYALTGSLDGIVDEMRAAALATKGGKS